MSARRLPLFVVLLLLAAPATAQLANIQIRAVSGDTVTGLDPSLTLDFVGNEGVNRSGEVALTGLVLGPGVDSTNNEVVILSDTLGGLTLVHREGPVPGIPGAVSSVGVDDPYIDDAGRVYVFINLSGPGITSGNNASYWIWDATNGFRLIFREGDAPPGSSQPLGIFAFNETAGATFKLGGTTGIHRLWRTDAAGDPEVFVEPGDLVDGVAITSLNAAVYAIGSPAGGAPVYANLPTGTVLSHFDAAGTGTLIYDFNDNLPGVGQELSTFTASTANGAEEVAFLGRCSCLFDADNAIFVGNGSALDLVAREGDQVPGAPAGVVFGASHPSQPFEAELLLTEGGRAVFRSDLIGTGVVSGNDTGLFAADTDGIWTVVRSGDQAPGYPSGWTYGVRNYDINDRGDVLFEARVLDDGAAFVGNALYVAHSPTTTPVRLIAAGDSFEVAPGDFRTIDSFNHGGLGNLENGQDRTTDIDTLAVSLLFTDGTSAAFTATLPAPSGPPAVPLLGALGAAAVAALLVLTGRRMRGRGGRFHA